jgi:hypothetical protein
VDEPLTSNGRLRTRPEELNSIPTPDYPNRAGVAAADIARLVIVGMFCVFQYWLLTSTMEAYHAGDNQVVIGAFFASLACFLLAGGLVVAGEIAIIKHQRYLRESMPRRGASSTIVSEQTKPFPTIGGPTPAARFHDTGDAAGGGDSG